MRTILMSSLVMGLVLSPAVADAQGRGERMRGAPAADPVARIIALRSELGLTDAQVSQLERIAARAKARSEPLLQKLRAELPEGAARGFGARPLMGRRLAPFGRRGPAGALPRMLRERRHELRADTALTAEQRSALRDSVRARMQQNREQLRNMTPEQRDELRARHQAQREQMRERTEVVRPILTELRANAESTRGEVESVLTSEQLAKLRELRPGRGPRGGRSPR